MENTLYNESCL